MNTHIQYVYVFSLFILLQLWHMVAPSGQLLCLFNMFSRFFEHLLLNAGTIRCPKLLLHFPFPLGVNHFSKKL